MTDLEITREILVGARELISKPERWTWLAIARSVIDENGLADQVDPISHRAVSWCATGAIVAVAHLINANAEHAYAALGRAIGGVTPVPVWNTVSNHAQILAGFDRAIASVESQLEVGGS